MKTLSQIFAHPVFEAMGWALLHSVWQGLLILLLLKLILHFVPARKAILRYGISLAGMAAILLAGIATVWFLLPQQPAMASSVTANVRLTTPAAMEISLPLFYKVAAYIERQMPVILTAWIVGILISTLRLAGGWMYISRLRRTALPVPDHWYELMTGLANQLGLNRVIQLSESAHVDSPAVIGLFKPIILVPIGMFTGLSPQQVEAVLLHELAHIRRHDFLVNLVQSFMEVIYFFNPFVWVVSSMVRDEREFCCDDEVVSHYNPRIYAAALAYLETSRAAKTRLSLSLSGGKNYLLHRIKRFMETSKQNNLTPQWVVPVALGAITVISTSWLTIGHDPGKDIALINAAATYGATSGNVPHDTISPPQEKRATYTRKKTVTIDEDGEPHEEIVENFEGDEDLQMNFYFNRNFDFAVDSQQWHSFAFDTLIDPQLFFFNPGSPDFDFQLAISDSFPPMPPPHWDVDAFRKEFETMFKEEFSDFYEDHEKDLQVMMDKLEEKFQHFSIDTTWQRDLRRSMQEVERNLEKLHEKMEKAREQNDGARIQRQEAIHDHQARMLAVQHTMQDRQHVHQQELALATARMETAREKMQEQLEKQQTAMENLQKQLVKDGYLEKGEPVKSLHWSNESMKVNGKIVKPKDVKRYEKLNDDWMNK